MSEYTTIHPLFRMTVLLRSTMGEKRFPATGFFVNIGGDNFLVSNKHVFEHEIGVTCDELIITYLSNRSSTETKMHRIELDEEDWLTHQREEPDVAVLPLTDFDPTQTGNIVIPSEGLVSKKTDFILSGHSNLIVGYPEGNWFSNNNTPLIRNGLTSTSFRRDFNDEPCFLIDAKLHDGMSGSPVLPSYSLVVHHSQREKISFNYEDLEYIPSIIGIHSGPVDEVSNLELQKIWHTDLIYQIISSS